MAIAVTVTDVPSDITTGLTPGRYVGQVRGEGTGMVMQKLLYATAETAPTEDGAYFQASSGDTFEFRVGAGVAPTWAKAGMPGATVRIAISPASAALPAEAASAQPSRADITVAALAAALGIVDLTRAGQLHEVGLAMVGRYAPTAPAEMANEAIRRFAGYLNEASYGATRSESVGPLSVDHQANHAAAWRNSGAGMLLTRWRVRRAGAIG